MSAKRGRKAGSFSFLRVPLAELNRVLKPEASVIVGYKYAVLVGLSGDPIKSENNIVEAIASSNSCQIEVEDFGDTDTDPTEENESHEVTEIDEYSFIRPVIEVEDFN
jgi:hypothetical protein